jgi:hypothetical protein
MNSKAPHNWEEEGKYHPSLVYIWKSWLNFIPVFDGKQTVDGSTLRLVSPSLHWSDQLNLDNKGIFTLLMHYMPTQLSNSLSNDLHPATAARLNGDLRSTCWQLVCQSVGKHDYEERCVKLNFSPYAFPYNGSQADIFSNDDVHEMMDSYFHFLVTVFNLTNKVHLCSIAVKNQVISLFGGEANFNRYQANNYGKFISATNDEKKYITCCHPEALLNPKYCKANTPGYAIIWDEFIHCSVPSLAILIHAKKLLILSMVSGVRSHSS